MNKMFWKRKTITPEKATELFERGKVTTIDPLKPPAGVIILTVLQYFDKKSGKVVCDVQGHINNEKFALDMLDTGKKAVIEYHKGLRAAADKK